MASLRGAMALVVLCGVAFTALRTASDLWLSVLSSLAVVLLLVAAVASRFRRGAEGAFWLGFAVFGWGLFLLGMGRASPLSDDDELNRGC